MEEWYYLDNIHICHINDKHVLYLNVQFCKYKKIVLSRTLPSYNIFTVSKAFMLLDYHPEIWYKTCRYDIYKSTINNVTFYAELSITLAMLSQAYIVTLGTLTVKIEQVPLLDIILIDPSKKLGLVRQKSGKVWTLSSEISYTMNPWFIGPFFLRKKRRSV